MPEATFKKSDEFEELVFVPATLKTWNNTICDIRIDNMKKTKFEIQSVELMYRENEHCDFVSLTVNGKTLHFDFAPYFDANGELFVSLDPEFLFFRRAMLYFEYFGETDDEAILSARKRFAELKAEGRVADGMIPKLANSFKAIDSGVARVIIKHARNLNNKKGTVLK